MSIKKVGKVWACSVDVGTSEKRIRKYKQFQTKHEAEVWERQMKAKRGCYSLVTFAEFWESYYQPYIASRLRPNTCQGYLEDFRRCEALYHLKLDAINVSHVQSLLDSIEAPFVKLSVFKLVRQMLKKAQSWDMVDRVVTDKMEEPRPKRKPITVINAEQFTEYLSATRDTPIFAGFCISLMGARRSEVCAVRWSDIDWSISTPTTFGKLHIQRTIQLVDGKEVEFPCKTENSDRFIIFPRWLGDELYSVRGVGYVMNEWGRRIEPRRYTDLWARCLKKAELPHVPLKDIRHSFATALIEAGANPYDVKEALGHEDIKTTLGIYVQKTDAPIERVADLLEVVPFAKICQNDSPPVENTCNG